MTTMKALEAITIDCWQLVTPGEPMVRGERSIVLSAIAPTDVVIEISGCGVCHTDLGFAFDGVRTRHPLPLTLGHEIAGRVCHVGSGAPSELLGQSVVVPAVLPCGECPACHAGRGAICPKQIFPGNDVHGGFASHVVVPSRGLCLVDEARFCDGLLLCDLAVVADAVTTPYQAIVNAGLAEGDVAIFVGVGGVGGFGAQLANALGAHVVAIDIDVSRLSRLEWCTELRLEARDSRDVKQTISAWVKQEGHRRTGWKIFETSGHPAGQDLAFNLLTYDAHLAIVGYTRDKVSVRLSNLMAFDATARGTWGCLPEHYPKVVDMVQSGDIRLSPFIERRPMDQINETFEALRGHKPMIRRPVLTLER